jgi:hypothetical protein
MNNLITGDLTLVTQPGRLDAIELVWTGKSNEFIQEARQRGVRLVMIYNEAVKWQKLSFNALRVFTKDAWLELRSV